MGYNYISLQPVDRCTRYKLCDQDYQSAISPGTHISLMNITDCHDNIAGIFLNNSLVIYYPFTNPSQRWVDGHMTSVCLPYLKNTFFDIFI